MGLNGFVLRAFDGLGPAGSLVLRYATFTGRISLVFLLCCTCKVVKEPFDLDAV